MAEAMRVLDGTTTSRVALLTGVAPEDIARLGGIQESPFIMSSVRPTLRCLRDDLSLPVPPIDRLLDEIDHPILNKAQEQFRRFPG